MRLRAGIATAGYLALGALLGFSPLELGVFGLAIFALTLLALSRTSGDRGSRLRRIGAFLFGGGIGGMVLLLSIVVRIGNICGANNGRPTVLPVGNASYDCYSIETLWALIPYGALVCLGGLLLFLAWRERTESTMSSRS
jgi:hypothetical protein